MPKNKLPPCPVCLTNKAVQLKEFRDTKSLVCNILYDGCEESTGDYRTEAEAIAPWARAARERAKLLAMVPVYGKEPNGLGNYWWQSDNKKAAWRRVQKTKRRNRYGGLIMSGIEIEKGDQSKEQYIAVLTRGIPVDGCMVDTSTHVLRKEDTIADLMAWSDNETQGSAWSIRLEITKPT